MKTKLFYGVMAIVLTVSFSACGNSNQKAANNEQKVEVADAAHNSRNSLDYEGTYIGTLPCADCPGIYTELTLKGNDYTLETIYTGKEDVDKNTFTKSGKYTWNTDGNIITLNNDSTQQYQVGENVLFALDGNGKRIAGDLAEFYVLKKNTLQ